MSLKRAREKRDDARKLLADGIDPSAKRRAEKEQQVNTFEAVAREWLVLQEKSLDESTLTRERSRLQNFVFPHLGNRPIAQITPPELLSVLRRIESRGTNDTAHRTRSICSRVFRYAVATGRAERDCTVDLRGALPALTVGHFAADVRISSASSCIKPASSLGTDYLPVFVYTPRGKPTRARRVQAVKAVVAWQFEAAMKKSAYRRPALPRCSAPAERRSIACSPPPSDVTLSSLQRAAALIARQLRLELV